ALLRDAHLRADRYLLDVDRRRHGAGRAAIEDVRVADALAGDQLQPLAAERMARPGGEVRERHLVAAAHARVDRVDLAREAIRGQPLGHRIGVDERLVEALGRGLQDAVQADGAGHGGVLVGWRILASYPPVERPPPFSTRYTLIFSQRPSGFGYPCPPNANTSPPDMGSNSTN